MDRYENDNEYILEILKKEEDRLIEKFNDNLEEDFKIEFARFLAVKNAIEKIKVDNAFEKGLYNEAI